MELHVAMWSLLVREESVQMLEILGQLLEAFLRTVMVKIYWFLLQLGYVQRPLSRDHKPSEKD